MRPMASLHKQLELFPAAQPPGRLLTRPPAQGFPREVRERSAGNIKTARSRSLAKLPRPARLRFNRDGARIWKAAAQTFCLPKVILGAGLCTSIRKCGGVAQRQVEAIALRAGAHGRLFIFQRPSQAVPPSSGRRRPDAANNLGNFSDRLYRVRR